MKSAKDGITCHVSMKYQTTKCLQENLIKGKLSRKAIHTSKTQKGKKTR